MSAKLLWSVALSVIAFFLILGLGALAWFGTGRYNIAATEPHLPLTAWALERVMEQSVRERAAEIETPELDDDARVRAGVHHFDATCVTCHGAPGRERSEIGRGLLPEPPALSEAVPEWSSAELFWIVKHGVKMSGMPAFGPTHSDEEIWGIVAFLRRLPDLTSAAYDSLAEDAAGGNGHDHQHAASGGARR